MELFGNIMRWGFSIIVGIGAISIWVWLVYEGVYDIISRYHGHYSFSYISGILTILAAFAILFLLGGGFCFINPVIAHLIGFN